ncbi:MAG: M3 family metallopeptidase, partial [Bdellovibrio sp.]
MWFLTRIPNAALSSKFSLVLVFSLLKGALAWGEGLQSPQVSSRSVDFEKGEVPIVAHYEKGALLALCESQLIQFDASLKNIENLKPRERSVEKTILAYERASADLSRRLGPVLALSKLSPIESTRQESLVCEEKHTKLMSKVPFRRSLYLSFLGFRPQEPEARRLWKETLRGFEANGATLNGAARKRAQKLQEKLALLENQYRNNVAQFNETLRFSAADLKGVDLQPLSAFLKKEGHYEVPVKASYLRPLIENAEAWQTRQRSVESIWNLAQKSNIPILKQATEIRKELAVLYGQKSWFDHRTSNKMAQSEKNVRSFLQSLRRQLREALEGDLQQVRAAKKEHLRGTPLENEELQIWDPPYYAEKLRQKLYQLDQNELKKFFPSEQVIAGVFQIYSRIFSVTFEELPQAEVWSPEVKA